MPHPPPARPHIGLNPRLSSFGSSEWAEDDAWDSASDSESPNHTPASSSWNKPKSLSAPKHVPKPTRNSSSSSSTLAFSYTHVQLPSPSSYPPRPESLHPQSSKNGWTLVRKSAASHDSEEFRIPDPDADPDSAETASVVYVGSVDDLDFDNPAPSKQDHGSLVRDEIDEIVNGTSSTFPPLDSPLLNV